MARLDVTEHYDECRKLGWSALSRLGSDNVTDMTEDQLELSYDDVRATARLTAQDKEDIIQDTFLAVLRKQEQMNDWLKEHPDVKWQWLWTATVKRQGVSHIRKRYRLTERPTDLEGAFGESVGEYDVTLSDELVLYDLLKQERLVKVGIGLIRGLQVQEIAEEMQVTRQTIWRAHKEIGKTLTERLVRQA